MFFRVIGRFLPEPAGRRTAALWAPSCRAVLLLLGVAPLLLGCDRKSQEPAASRLARQGEGASSGASPAREASSIMDANGKLLASDTRVFGLALPRGSTPYRDEGRRHIFRSIAPTKAVIEYFAARLLTGQVDRIGQGAVFRRALPREAPDALPTELEVSVLPSSSTATRIEIRELRAAPAKPVRAEELDQKLESLRRLD